jgi:predicted GNAT family N-acyltransferase
MNERTNLIPPRLDHGEALDDEIAIKEIAFESNEMVLIGHLRFQVWLEEGSLDENAFPDKSWIDPSDSIARHFIAVRRDGVIAGAARLVTHSSAATNDRDVDLWLSTGNELKWPVCDLGRLVVSKSFRNRGIASRLNEVRLEAARALGARAVIATASAGNVSLLRALGFFAIGQEIVFSDRPNTVFHGLQLNFPESLHSP